jgi:hypothetical protein
MMNALMVKQPGRISPSSSRRVEEAIVASGLPLQASIAGNLALPDSTAVWLASVERVGQERSRVEPLPAHVPPPVEEELLQGLVFTLAPTFWTAQGGLVRGCANCVFLTALHHGNTIPVAPRQAYLVRLTRTDLKEDGGQPEEDVPLPVGLQGVRLSVEAARKIRDILDDPSYPTHAGKEMPTADPAVLLGKRDR